MNNIITAIINLVREPQLHLKQYAKSHNRANNMGEALEEYVKDLFANTMNATAEERVRKQSEVFCYIGNQNNPPDIMLRNGDAIEVKKIESCGSALALNSSYPKAVLFADSPMITKDCRECENWTQKDMIYSVGVIKDDTLIAMAMVYGDEYCAVKLDAKEVMDIGYISRKGIALSTIGQQVDVMASSAMELLLMQINERRKSAPERLVPEHRIITPVLVKRETAYPDRANNK